PAISPPLLAAAVLFAATGLLLAFQGGGKGGAAAPGNPFSLGALLVFAVIFALVATASAAIVDRFGSGSLLLTSALSGTFDVDVATLSALRLSSQGVPVS